VFVCVCVCIYVCLCVCVCVRVCARERDRESESEKTRERETWLRSNCMSCVQKVGTRSQDACDERSGACGAGGGGCMHDTRVACRGGGRV